MKAYDEVVEFIASRNPREVIAFKPSEQAKQRVWGLVERQKESELSAEEQAELQDYMQLEHLMRLAKAHAHKLLAHEQ
jgi:hypothetical protein